MTLTLKNTLKLLVVLLLTGWGQNSFSSMNCSTAMGGPIEPLNVGVIKITPAQISAGAVIWRSPTITRQLSCSLSRGEYNSLNAFFYLDPKSTVANLDPSLEIGVTYLSSNFKVAPVNRIDVGPAARCIVFCEDDAGRFKSQRTYTSLPFNVSFQVYVKLTGKPPLNAGVIPSFTHTVLQVGGGADTSNTLPTGNFTTTLSGLNQISFITCRPTITVTGNNGQTVNFGTISSKQFVPNTIAKQVPFSVNVNMSGADNGQACPRSTMQATFSTTHDVRNRTTIMPAENSRFGIVISKAATPTVPIVMNSVVDLGLVNGTVVQNKFMAGVQWLTVAPLVGPFTASATVDITFK
jgi:type 1 fimbria pilin